MSNRVVHKGNSRHSKIVPYRIGILLDRDDDAHRDLVDAVRLGIDEFRENGSLDRDVEIELREVRGAPDGSALDVVAAWRDLFENDTLLGIVGPFTDENGTAVRPLVETGGMPTLTTSAADSFCGNYCFQLTVDHPADNLHLLLHHGSRSGCVHPVLVREAGPRGNVIETLFRQAATQNGHAQVEVVECGAMFEARLSLARHAGADMLVHLGSKHETIDAQLSQMDWQPLRLTGTEISRAHPVDGDAAILEGWTGLDAVHEDNKQFRSFRRAFNDRYGREANHLRAAQGYDIGKLIGMVLVNIRPPSPEGLRDGLDRVRMLMTATGAPGTVVSFTRYDHRGLKNNPHVFKKVTNGALIDVSVPAM